MITVGTHGHKHLVFPNEENRVPGVQNGDQGLLFIVLPLQHSELSVLSSDFCTDLSPAFQSLVTKLNSGLVLGLFPCLLCLPLCTIPGILQFPQLCMWCDTPSLGFLGTLSACSPPATLPCGKWVWWPCRRVFGTISCLPLAQRVPGT